MPKVKLGLDKLSVAQLLELAKQITAALTGNASFPTPNPPLMSLIKRRLFVMIMPAAFV